MRDAPPISPTAIACIGCGYDLSGTAIGGQCPECGRPVSETLQSQSNGERSCGSATACFVIGIISLVGCGVLGPVAIILYFTSKQELNKGGYAQSARTFAKVALTLGIISTALIGVYVLLLAAMVVFG